MQARHAWGWVVLACGVLFILGGAALLYRGLTQQPESASPAQSIACRDVVAGCLLPGEGLRIAFDHYPQVMKPFRLSVEVQGAHAIYASFTMQGMQMGFSRYRLRADSAGVWKADITLPLCTDERSDWEMMLEVDGRLYQLPFQSN